MNCCVELWQTVTVANGGENWIPHGSPQFMNVRQVAKPSFVTTSRKNQENFVRFRTISWYKKQQNYFSLLHTVMVMAHKKW
jgi:hypothetical protein